MSDFLRGAENLRKNAKKAAGRPRLSKTITRATDHAILRRLQVMQEIDFDEERRKITNLRQFATDNIEALLDRFIAAAQAKGIQCHLAENAQEARDIVIGVAKSHSVKTVVKSKSMLGEEVGIRPALRHAGMEVTETDLGEYIVQLNHEPPSHLTAPAVHLSTREVGRILYKEAGIGPFETPAAMAGGVREYMKTRFLHADMGLAGSNAIVANTGSMLMMSNEGNIRLVITLPALLVVMVSVDKLVTDTGDLAALIRVIPKNATGQRITNYCTLLAGPGQGQELHVVIVDNNRIAATKDPVFSQATRCVRCAACINVCPVFRTIGGHAYGSVYVGPMGIALTNALGLDPYAQKLANACTLCDACAEVCPAGIDLPGLILRIRADTAANAGERFKAWLIGFVYAGAGRFRATFAMLRAIKAGFSGMYRIFWRLAGWKGRRGVPQLAKKSFDQMWKEDNANRD